MLTDPSSCIITISPFSTHLLTHLVCLPKSIQQEFSFEDETQLSADISVSSVSFLFYCPILSYTSWQKQTNKQTTQKELVGCTAWRLLLCLDSTSSRERRTKEEAEAERGSCWFTMDRVAVNINNGEEQRTTRGDGIRSPPTARTRVWAHLQSFVLNRTNRVYESGTQSLQNFLLLQM